MISGTSWDAGASEPDFDSPLRMRASAVKSLSGSIGPGGRRGSRSGFARAIPASTRPPLRKRPTRNAPNALRAPAPDYALTGQLTVAGLVLLDESREQVAEAL